MHSEQTPCAAEEHPDRGLVLLRLCSLALGGRDATHLDAPRELNYEIDEIYICEDNSNALALPPTLRRRCHWHRRRRDGAEPLLAAFNRDALQLRG